jgi:hypothetical protein
MKRGNSTGVGLPRTTCLDAPQLVLVAAAVLVHDLKIALLQKERKHLLTFTLRPRFQTDFLFKPEPAEPKPPFD